MSRISPKFGIAYHATRPWSTCITLIFAVVTFEYTTLEVQTRLPDFDGKRIPVPISVFVANGARCDEVPALLAKISTRSPYPVAYTVRGECTHADPTGNPARYFLPGELALVLDPMPFYTGTTQEADVQEKRFFMTRINPRTADYKALPHEMQHLLRGHGSIKTLFMPEFFARAFLDVTIEPYELFGDQWPLPTALVLALLLVGAIFLARSMVIIDPNASRSPLGLR